MHHPFVYMLYILLIAAALIIDQAVKIYVSSVMTPGESVSVIQGFFHITYIHNDGAAFGILAGHSTVLIVIPAVILAAVTVYLAVRGRNVPKMMGIALSLIAAGGTGNIVDRVIHGYVIDFLDFKIWNPVFNVADVFICTGCGLMILYILAFDRKE